MPIYEEKLICPLAVRFTQSHIRPVFQNGGQGNDLEATIQEITTSPGSGDYDVILESPFPNIEILRWHSRDGGNKNCKHWFTLDNRRLYCLQRAAAALWPKRVAVKVEVLYAAPEDIARKDNSSTHGCSVGIGHSLKQLTGEWNWRETVAEKHSELAAASHKLVEADDQRHSVQELLDAPAPLSMLERFLAATSPQTQDPPLRTEKLHIDTQSQDSTTDQSTPRGSEASSVDNLSPLVQPAALAGVLEKAPWPACKHIAAEGGTKWEALKAGIEGKWQDNKGGQRMIKQTAAGYSWACVRTDPAGRGSSQKKFELWYDEETDLVWWGDWSHCLDASKVRKGSCELCWFSGKDRDWRKPRFTWQRQQ